MCKACQKYSKRGQLINGVRRMSVFVYINHESITDHSTQAFTHWVQTMQQKAKEKETAWKHYWLFYMKIQPRKVKIMKIRASWDPLKSGGPGKVSPVPPPPTLGGPAYAIILAHCEAQLQCWHSQFSATWQHHHYLDCCLVPWFPSLKTEWDQERK